MYRLYVERKPGFRNEADRIKEEINGFLGITSVTDIRYLNRYDIDHVSETVAKAAAVKIFSEPQSDFYAFDEIQTESENTVIIWEYLPGQYDQRADSAEQCLSLLRAGIADKNFVEEITPIVRCAKMVILSGTVSADDIARIEKYLINPVDSRLTTDDKPQSLEMTTEVPADIPVVTGFITFKEQKLEAYRQKMGLAMDYADIAFLQDYFKKENRDPTETEIRVLDTYWSDHCRHTTFLTELDSIKIEKGPYSALFEKSLKEYTKMRTDLYVGRKDKPVTLMDMAVIGAKYLKKQGKLENLEVSEEINACSIYIDVHYTTDGKGSAIDSTSSESIERWLLMFKNETHNHPTEIEPFGGAATCIGGAIRDPLSGRSWVYQAMRVTGAADPTVSLDKTMKGKLPQLKLVREAAQGYSSYGNQIGLTTGQVTEFYHPGYAAKRMELGAVIAASPADMVIREKPEPGDIVILLGGGTGRDGIGGATGSSKIHTEKSVTTAAAEVQKGNAVEERKIQRLFRNKSVSLMIRRCNDFGAGGVSVAVGELAPGLDINLDAVPKKYEGLNGTELAISESQERMAVVVRKTDAQKFIDAAAKENLNAVIVAVVTDSDRLVMKWKGKIIVDIGRKFLDAAGAVHHADAVIENPAEPKDSPLVRSLDCVQAVYNQTYTNNNAEIEETVKNGKTSLEKAWLAAMADESVCSQRGLSERFDGSIGSATVTFPYGGRYQCTPEAAMVAKIPVVSPQETSTVSMMSFGFDPAVCQWSPWHGAQISVLSSLTKILCVGGDPSTCRLSFQEFFGRAVDNKTWGYPAAALLGALSAQKAAGTAAIGGKDSMSGTFENISVPHTLVSFAVTTDDVTNVTSGAFKKANDSVYIIKVPYSDILAPDFDIFSSNAAILYNLNKSEKISAMYPVNAGGIAEAVSKMALGNRIGAELQYNEKDLFIPYYGAILVETTEKLETKGFAAGTVEKIGITTDSPSVVINGTVIELSSIEKVWEKTLSKVFPSVSGAGKQAELPEFAKKIHTSLSEIRRNPVFKTGSAKPRVIIPVFPGTNCEYDMARAFNLAGAETKILVFTNRTPKQLAESLAELQKEIKKSQIIALAGGFSAGDEPDGSGKFIANVLREGHISEAVMNLVETRKGLILGICNGFQALVKTGLVPYGKIIEPSEDMPTLTFNKVGRHISRIVRTRMVSAKSPWAMNPSVIDERTHIIPISHGEGRIVISREFAEKLFVNGQIFSQYVDIEGNPSISEPENPNGSLFAIEGMTSPDGHILGKMGHSERSIGTGINGVSLDLIKNIAGNPLTNENESSCQNIFAAGVSYFN